MFLKAYLDSGLRRNAGSADFLKSNWDKNGLAKKVSPFGPTSKTDIFPAKKELE